MLENKIFLVINQEGKITGSNCTLHLLYLKFLLEIVLMLEVIGAEL